MATKFYALLILNFVFIECKIPNNLDTIRNELENSKLFDENLEEHEKNVDKMLQEKCEKNGNPDAFKQLQDEKDKLRECIAAHLNTTKLYEELDEAKKTGSMDEVFESYCAKYPIIYDCIEDTSEYLRICLDDKEKNVLNQSLELTDRIKDFVCDKSGDRMAMFVAEGGLECLESRRDYIERCFNYSNSFDTDLNIFSNGELQNILANNTGCQELDNLQKCIIQELDQCKDTTPANIAEAFFKFLKKNLSCHTIEKSSFTSKSTSFYGNLLLIIVLVSSIFRL